MAKKRKSVKKTHKKTRHHSKRKSVSVFRHNPPMKFTSKGIVTKLTNGAIDATEIVVGKAIARSVPTLFGIPTAGPIGLIVQIGGGIVAGFLGDLVSPNAGKMMLASGLAAPIESAIKQMNVPFISSALGEELVEVSAYPEISAYPDMDSMGAYPVEMGEATYSQQ